MKTVKRVISVMLGVMMLITLLPMNAIIMASEREDLVYNEPFDNKADFSALGSSWSVNVDGRASITDGKDESGLKIEKNATDDNVMATYTLKEPISTGKYKVSYSVKPGAGIDTNFHIANASAVFWANFIGSSGNMSIGTTDAVNSPAEYLLGNHSLNEWYDFENILDFTSGTFSTKMTDKDGNVYNAGSVPMSLAEPVTKFEFQIWGGAEASSVVDNFSFVKITEVFDDVSLSFDEISSLDGIMAINSENIEIIDGGRNGSGKALKIQQAGNGSAQATYTFLKPLKTGRYKLKYSIKPGSNITTNVHVATDLGLGQYFMTNIIYPDGKIWKGTDNIYDSAATFQLGNADWEMGKWYDFETIIDLDNQTVESNVTDENGKFAHSAANPIAWGTHSTGNIAQIALINFQIWSDNDSVSLFDNISIEEITGEPSVAKNDITIKDSNDQTIAWDGVNSGAKTFTVNFNKEMDSTSLNPDTVYIVNTENNEKIAYNGEYADGIYAMTLASRFVGGKAYKLVITTGAKTTDGKNTSKGEEFAFNTVEEKLQQETILEVSENFNEITALGNSWATASGIDASVEGGMLKVNLDANTDNSRIDFDLGKTITSGKYKFTYDFKPGIGITTNVELLPEDKTTLYFMTTINDAGQLRYGSLDDGYDLYENMELDVWYKAEITLDLDKQTSSYVIKNEAGNVIASNNRDLQWCNMSRPGLLTNVRYIGFQTWAMKDAYSYFDNVSFMQIVDTPVVKAENMEFITAEGNQVEDLSSVSTTVNKITVDFGTVMNVETLSSDTIKVVNTKTSEEVEYWSSYSNGVYTMELAKTLDKNTKYNVVIDGTVANVKGVTLSGVKTVEFTTEEGVFKAELKTLTVNNSEITKISDLKLNDVLKIGYDYTNTTGEDKTLYVIVAYYNADRCLVSVDYAEKIVDKSVAGATYYSEHNVPDMTDVTAVKVMTWDGWDTMRPLSLSREI